MCIDCNVCRMMTPTVYSRLGQQSIVYNQPSSDDERLSALQVAHHSFLFMTIDSVGEWCFFQGL
jgi:hypothetical protein